MAKQLRLLSKIELLRKQLAWPKFIYIGDCGADYVGKELRPGGCALNVSYYLHRLKQKSNVLTWIGDDYEAKTVLEMLRDLDVDESAVHQKPGQTPTQFIRIQANGEKKFERYEVGVLGKAQLTKDDKLFINQHHVLVTLCYTQILDLFNQVTQLHFNGIKVVDFMSLADFNYDLNFVKKYVHWFDIALFGLHQNQVELIDQIRNMSKEYEKLCIVTLGDAGSKVFLGEHEYFQPTKATKIIDTTGCGDAFLAGFLSTFLHNQNVSDAMECASHMAAHASTYVGAIPKNMSYRD